MGYFSSNRSEYSPEFVSGTYRIIKKAMDDYSSDKTVDYYRFSHNIGKGRRQNLTEKVRQQEFYLAHCALNDGLFVYDLEYQESGKSNGNQPDALALRFDKQGKVKALVAVEMKSKKESEKGKSGTEAHLEAMAADFNRKEYLEEAREILRYYSKKSLQLSRSYAKIIFNSNSLYVNNRDKE